MFFVAPLRAHWSKKHHSPNAGLTVDKNLKSVKMNRTQNTTNEQEAVVSSLAIHYTDANIRIRAVERKTLYNFAKKLHELYVKAGPSTPFASLFPNEKICCRKMLTNRLKSISLNLQALLW